MATKKEKGLDPVTQEIRKAAEDKSLIIGTDVTVKNLKQGKLSKIFLAANCNVTDKEDIKHFASVNGTEIVELTTTNDDLGVVCRKPFSIAVVSIVK